jgi:hypothetical protein
MTDTLPDHLRDAHANLKSGIQQLHLFGAFPIPDEIHKAMHALSYAVKAAAALPTAPEPGWLQPALDSAAKRANAMPGWMVRRDAATPADAKAEPLREAIARILDPYAMGEKDTPDYAYDYPLRKADALAKADAIMALAPPAVDRAAATGIREALAAIIKMDDDALSANGKSGANLNGYGLVDLFDHIDHPFGSGKHKQQPCRSNQLEMAMADARAALAQLPAGVDRTGYDPSEHCAIYECKKEGCQRSAETCLSKRPAPSRQDLTKSDEIRRGVDRAADPVLPGSTITVIIPSGYDTAWDFLNDCGLESVPTVDRAALAQAIRKALIENWREDLGAKWDEDVLLTGCRKVGGGRGYQNAEEAAQNLALDAADAVIKLLPTDVDRVAVIEAGKQAKFRGSEGGWFGVTPDHNNPDSFEYRTIYALADAKLGKA